MTVQCASVGILSGGLQEHSLAGSLVMSGVLLYKSPERREKVDTTCGSGVTCHLLQRWYQQIFKCIKFMTLYTFISASRFVSTL